MKYYAINNKTKEVYECNKAKLIADIASEHRISELEARNQIEASSINNPIKLNDYECWPEDDNLFHKNYEGYY